MGGMAPTQVRGRLEALEDTAPTAAEKAALDAADGTPAADNPYVLDDDSRLGGAVPIGPAGGDLGGTYPNPTVNVDNSTIEKNANALRLKALGVTDAHVAAANKDGTTSTPSMRTLGTGAQQAAAGNDARMRGAFTVHTASAALAASDTPVGGKTHTNTGAGALVELTLPACAAGLRARFIVTNANGIKLIAGAGDQIVLDPDNITAAAGSVQSTTRHSLIEIEGGDDTFWYAVAQGTWS